jgi:hypothetical protein
MATRMSDSLKLAVDAQAKRLGITTAEFTREALAAHVVWHQALDAVEQGHKIENLRDPAYVAGLLGR